MAWGWKRELTWLATGMVAGVPAPAIVGYGCGARKGPYRAPHPDLARNQPPAGCLSAPARKYGWEHLAQTSWR